MPKTEAQKRAQENYMGHFKRFSVRLAPDLYDQMKDHADKLGTSANDLITRAIKETIARDREKLEWD